MKLRLRYRNTTKIIEVPQHVEDSFTVSDVLADASHLFSSNFNGEGYFLSLNKKEPVGESDDRLSVCSVVSGDILHIVSSGDDLSPAKKQNIGANKDILVKSPTHGENDTTFNQNPGTSHSNEPASNSNMGAAESEYSADQIKERNEGNVNPNQEVQVDESYEMEEVVNHDVIRRCLSEPVLCRETADGCVPALLKEMVSSMKPVDETEALCVVLHVLMLETGFIVQVSGGNEGSTVPDTWRCPGHYKIIYTYTGCIDTQCSLSIIPTGCTLTVHGKVAGPDSTTRHCSVKVSDFVQGDISDCENCYHQLAKLSQTFKDSIASPLVQDIRTAAGLENIHGILALTQEVKLRIFSFLDVQSLLKLSSVCQDLRDIHQDPYLWRRLYLKDFGNRSDNSLSQNWKQLYKQQFKIRKERRKMMNRFTPVTPSTWIPQNPFGGPSNWIPPGPGMIGGDYDLYPTFPGLPGVPGRLGPRPLTLPRPRYDLIGPNPDPDTGPDLIPRRPLGGRHGGPRNPFGGFGPRFF